MKILLVNPEFPDTYWSFRHALPFEGKRSAFPPLGLLTVSALLPRTWERRLVDLNVEPLKSSDIEWADMVFATAMLVQKESLQGVVKQCKALGKRVVIGGPYITTSAESLPEADHIFLGEAETTLPGVRARPGARLSQARLQGAGAPPALRLARPALRPRRTQTLQRDVGPVLARLPVPLRVLRHHRDLRPRPAHQEQRADAGRTRRAQRHRVARHGLHRGRQLHRQQAERQAPAARAGRVAGAARPPVRVPSPRRASTSPTTTSCST